MADQIEEAATFVAYAVKDGRETKKTFGLVKIVLQLTILLLGVTTHAGRLAVAGWNSQ
ncbi:hypothetical protein [Solidesulfovibrio carbinoliphilus]|uniref:hypothetical protein n=1 Tax=Solidesulfovibrio carbinoliphilus TaxID=345370 RepID=UPI001E619396|nr:hypothetical protein [Solidesulfovibrio carbinoliphilus]